MGKERELKVQRNRLNFIDEAIRAGTKGGRYPNANKLSAETGVSTRTILRDIEYMRDMWNAPIEYDYTKKGFYYSQENFYLKAVPLTEGELFSIALFNQLLEQYRNTPLEEALRTIFAKIVQCLPDNISVDTSFLNNQVSFISDKIGKIDIKVFQTIFDAMHKKNTMIFEYKSLSQDEYSVRTADPYHAICQRGNWYFIGYCHNHKKPRMFSFTRVKKVKLSKNKFIKPEDFDPNNYFDKEMGIWNTNKNPKTIELHFDKEARGYALERQWHSTQTIKENKDGSFILKFTTTQIPEVLRWVLGQGHTVKVLKPAELVKMVKEESQKTRALYS